MPPKSARKGSGWSAGPRRTGSRAAKAKALREAEAAEEPPKFEEVAAPVIEAKEEEIKAEEVVQDDKPSVTDSAVNGSVDVEYEEDVKEAYEDEGERLELEDNEPEYEHEEDAAVDYDEKDLDHDEGQEEYEGDVVEEEDPEMVDEMEDGEGVEVEEDDENAEEEPEVDPEEEEHHEIVKEHRKRKEYEVFVGGLDRDATEEDLRKVFGEVGEITEVRLMMNPITKKNKGFAFLRFATVEQAKRAVSEIRNPVVRGKQCGVAPSHDSDTLFVGNICKTWTKEHLKEKLKSYGVDNFEDLTLVEDGNKEGTNRGFAFLEFSSRSEAMHAYRRLQKRDVVLGLDRSAKVSFADSYHEPDDEIMAQVRTVFIDGLSAGWDENRVSGYLKKYGAIEKIELARNMPAAKRKDFGFVTFDSHDNAVECADSINNTELGEGDNKVKVRARLSRPHQKGRGKRSLRGNYRIGLGPPRVSRLSYGRPPPRRAPPPRLSRPLSARGAPIGARGFKRPISIRDRRPVLAVTERPRRLPPPERTYERRPPVPAYPKVSSRRDYGRQVELPPARSRAAAVEYSSRDPIARRSSYRDEYSSRGSGYSDIPPSRSASRTSSRHAYPDDGYGRKLDRPLPTYREGRGREYDSISGSKRPYAEIDDAPPRYSDVSIRHSRARVDYGVSSSRSHYADPYGDRLGRSHVGYSSSRSSISGQDGMYSSRHGMNYSGGSVSGSDVGGMYSSNYGNSYVARGSDVGGSSYLGGYSSRSLGSSGYLGGSGSGSYY
ncbi:nucleolin isoform X1 [Ananas comosus]|uniref:Nucleolin isoform X1 n=1 Tax=Ananas comosus TaxID=4615 RepID=A0A6P5EJQ4_ANACO|nr:nucleolin isoform X1 [Ananas comosus]XP_020083760.1 nucleolin isoform X1 [Ananas comosus]XP_020083761.1 nucleolin isoform X1 [Ananas comosus]